MSRKMNRRLAEHDENARDYRAGDESVKAGYLRKKMEQGKRFNPRR